MWSNTTFQEISSKNIINAIFFYDSCITTLSAILTFVLITILFLLKNRFTNFNFLQNHKIELLWSILPVIILLFIAVPSVNTLYKRAQDFQKVAKTLNITGSQWQWNYQFSHNNKTEILDDAIKNCLNYTDNVNKVLPVPVDSKNLKITVTREDVIHSWFLPAAGIKVDAVPGKITEQNITFMRNGYIFGNCTEVCGPFHRIIPIKLAVFFNK